VPKLWNATIAAHRDAVRRAILEAAWALVSEQGLAPVTMTQIAERVGIGRATLYGYFPDVPAILLAWHEQQVAQHVAHLSELPDRAGGAGARLDAALETYAMLRHRQRHHGSELVAPLHGGEHVARAQRQVIDLIRDLVREAVAAGAVRDDIPPGELAAYCVHTLAAAGSLPSQAAVRRLLTLVRSALRPR
jgi:AcrR family transcriptional regulator